jgi:hypothetical protein
VTQTLPALQQLHAAGHLVGFHAMNLHYTGWQQPGVMKPSWLHCVPIGMRLRFYGDLTGFRAAIRSNVVERPRSFWSDKSRPLLLVPFIPKHYARDRGRALRELGANVRKKVLTMTQQTYPNQNGEER